MEEVGGFQVEPTRMLLRLLSQFIGLILLLFGTAVAIHVLFKVLKILDDPVLLGSQVQAFMELLGSEPMSLDTAAGRLDLGRTLALAACIVWTSLSVWIPLALIHAGARLIAWNQDERQIRQVAKQLFSEARRSEGGTQRIKPCG